ncbi:MAG: hypothetical protein GXY41_00470 [Phycisphaerae bacterium]|nr:hypothetical protein [Phycisphaerae bacterium]
MSLRERILVILLILFCGCLVVEYATYRWLMYPVFTAQEQRQAEGVVESALNAINGQFSALQQQVVSHVHSSSFYTILQTQAPPQFEDELAGFDFVLLYDVQWNPRWHIVSEGLDADTLGQLLIGDRTALLSKDLLGFSRNGIVRMNGAFAYVVAEPIVDPAKRNSVEGTVLAGQFISDKQLLAIRKQFQINFQWDLLSDEGVKNRNAELLSRINRQNPYHSASISDNFFQISTVLFDYQNQPAILLKTFHDRTISDHGIMTMYKLILIKLGIGFVAVIFLTGVFQVMIVNPIVKLIRHIIAIEHPGRATGKLALSQRDEIGTLVAEFDQMCRRVQNAQIKLMEKSYLSGVTEMSSGILHNVRNALSPITTRIDRIKEHFQDISLDNLAQAQRELQDAHLDPQRREDLTRFVELSFQNVIDTLKEMVAGLDELFEQVVQIEDMLNTQRSFGIKQDRPVEYIEPIELLNNALEFVPEHYRKNNRIDVSASIKKLPSIPVHPTTFVQILQNLLINAAESLEREKPLYPKISIRCTIEPGEPVDRLHWTIRDNGAGIAAESLERIFERGSSSKTKGLTGIGLHWCAVTINAMGGRLWASSDGVHCGAYFHLLIPIAATECPADSKRERNNVHES